MDGRTGRERNKLIRRVRILIVLLTIGFLAEILPAVGSEIPPLSCFPYRLRPARHTNRQTARCCLFLLYGGIFSRIEPAFF